MAQKRKLAAAEKRVEFHYTASNHHRVIKIDGAHGGVNSKGEIQMSVFSELLPLPRIDEYKFDDDGQLGERTKHADTNLGLTREIEVTLRLDLNTARAVAVWLNQKADQLDGLRTINLTNSPEAETAADEELKKD